MGSGGVVLYIVVTSDVLLRVEEHFSTVVPFSSVLLAVSCSSIILTLFALLTAHIFTAL